jgi:hypothetical protein
VLCVASLVRGDASAAPVVLDPSLAALNNALVRNGFKVVLQHPKQKDAYGVYEAKTKTLWISPLAFELGIGRQVFIHEAVHAAQSCPNGVLSPIGWNHSLPKAVEREVSAILYNSYRHQNKALEREAFMAQGQSNGVELLIKALRARCGR